VAEISAVVQVGSEMGMERAQGRLYGGFVSNRYECLALQDCLENVGVPTRSPKPSIECEQIVELYISSLKPERHSGKRPCGLISRGTGNPYFSTDTTAAITCS